MPLVVSSYGLVTNLRQTGSIAVPPKMRQWYLSLLRRRGFNRTTLGQSYRSPAQVLADPGTAVVRVEGLIQPGASRGQRFDVLVTALEGTQTTSLEHGALYSADLGLAGANEALLFSRPLAVARGPIYVDALASRGEGQTEHMRQAMVIAGGIVRTDRRIELLLNQASWTRSRIIADRINERFAAAPVDRHPTATAVDDMTVRLAIPRRFTGNAQRLVQLISHLYLRTSVEFEPAKAQELADLVEAAPKHAEQAALAWEALGKMALPVVCRYYEHADDRVRLAALTAGSYLKDPASVGPLVAISEHADDSIRGRASQLLVQLPQTAPVRLRVQQLLDDAAQTVRVAAYEAVAASGDPMSLLRRRTIGPRRNGKFILDLVPSSRSLIYVVQDDFPRIAVFGVQTNFLTPLQARLWDNQLMLKAEGPRSLVEVFYQSPEAASSRRYQIAPTVANLIVLLGAPAPDASYEGLDLSYGQVVNALYQLSANHHIDAKVVVRQSALASAIASVRAHQAGTIRPVTGADPAADAS